MNTILHHPWVALSSMLEEVSADVQTDHDWDVDEGPSTVVRARLADGTWLRFLFSGPTLELIEVDK